MRIAAGQRGKTGMERVVVLTEDRQETVKEFLRRRLSLSSALLSRIKTVPGGLQRNGESVFVSAVLQPGDRVRVLLEPEEAFSENVYPVNLPLSVVYEDDDLLILNKPPKMPVHPSKGHVCDSLANAVAGYYARQGKNFTFRCVNRLDKDTSGLIAVAKNAYSHQRLIDQMRQGILQRTYIALAEGKVLPAEGKIETDIRRIPDTATIRREVCPDGEGEKAVTFYETQATKNGRTLLKIRLKTGRTHQIRVHFSHIGHPLTGDWLYGREREGLRQALHSSVLSLIQPLTGQSLSFSAPLPEDFLEMMNLPPSEPEA